MMYQRPIPVRRQNNSLVPAWLAVVADVFILYIAYNNLMYNKRGALASERIAQELRVVNQSKFMDRLNSELEKENTHGKLPQDPKTD